MGNAILLADKSVTIQKIVQLTFADDNLKIHCVADGQAALDSIPLLKPDLILADISLPLKSGYDVCRAIRTDPALSEYSTTPVILLAGIYETMDEERAKQVEDRVKEVDANDFLSKPFDPQVLIAKVKQYMKPPAQSAPPENIFAAAAESPENIFSMAESTVVEPPPDDGERTMMIPGGVSFGDSMFAESLPYEDEPQAPKSPDLDIESMKPVGEPLFDPDSQEFSQSFGEDAGTTMQVETPTFTPLESYNPSVGSEPAFAEEPNVSSDVMPLVLPAEDPFSEVFDEPAAASGFVAPAASEEDSPFGLPPVPPVPEPEPQVEAQPIPFVAAEAESMEIPPAAEMPSVAPEEEQVEYEDTWPGVVAPRLEPAVEELFESEPAVTSGAISMEEAEELEPDFTETAGQDQEVQEEVQVSPQPVTEITAPVNLSSPASVEVTDDLVARIAEQVVAKLSERVVSEIVWQVVPDLAEKMIRRELEKLHAGEE